MARPVERPVTGRHTEIAHRGKPNPIIIGCRSSLTVGLHSESGIAGPNDVAVPLPRVTLRSGLDDILVVPNPVRLSLPVDRPHGLPLRCQAPPLRFDS